MELSVIFRACVDLLILVTVSNFFAILGRWYFKDDEGELTLNSTETEQLDTIARMLVADGKGILAVDESVGTMAKRFSAVLVENTPENRRQYREMLFTTPNLSQYISGIIFHEETFHQVGSNGKSLVEIVREAGILIGIKLDLGLVNLEGSQTETTTQGLETLEKRATQFKNAGAQFAKWRCVLHIGEKIPTIQALEENANILARFAVIVQRVGLVPIVEPEVLRTGNYTLEKVRDVTEKALVHACRTLEEEGVRMQGTLLKPNMVTDGLAYTGIKASETEIASFTLNVLLKTVPSEIPGIVFLSGGQTEQEATANLNAINKIAQNVPWKLSFSFGRALQNSALRAWKEHGITEVQKILLERARVNSLAARGIYE